MVIARQRDHQRLALTAACRDLTTDISQPLVNTLLPPGSICPPFLCPLAPIIKPRTLDFKYHFSVTSPRVETDSKFTLKAEAWCCLCVFCVEWRRVNLTVIFYCVLMNRPRMLHTQECNIIAQTCQRHNECCEHVAEVQSRKLHIVSW